MHRRGFLALGLSAGSGVTRAFAKGEFWNEKPPAEWSDSEIDRLLTKSPWAKEVGASADMGEMRGGGGRQPSLGGAGRKGGGGGLPRGGGGGGKSGGGGRDVKVTVCWESAPVREALKRGGAADAYYVVTLTGLPLAGRTAGQQAGGDAADRRKAALARLRESSTLAVKGKPAATPESVETAPSPKGQMVVLRFSRRALPIEASDKEATFTARLGPLEVKAKFSFKEMTWKGQLAL